MDFMFLGALWFIFKRIKTHPLHSLKQFRVNASSYTLSRARHTFYYYVVYSRYTLKLPGIEFVEVYKIARSIPGRVFWSGFWKCYAGYSNCKRKWASQDLPTRYTRQFRPGTQFAARVSIARDKISEEPRQRFPDDLFWESFSFRLGALLSPPFRAAPRRTAVPTPI
jgi:hypothetical protein